MPFSRRDFQGRRTPPKKIGKSKRHRTVSISYPNGVETEKRKGSRSRRRVRETRRPQQIQDYQSEASRINDQGEQQRSIPFVLTEGTLISNKKEGIIAHCCYSIAQLAESADFAIRAAEYPRTVDLSSLPPLAELGSYRSTFAQKAQNILFV